MPWGILISRKVGLSDGRIKFAAKDIQLNQNERILYVALIGVPEESVEI